MKKRSMTNAGRARWRPGRKVRGRRRAEKTRILDELVAITGSTGSTRGASCALARPGRVRRRKAGQRVYDDAVREALVVLWEASDRIGRKRLKADAPAGGGDGAARPSPARAGDPPCAAGHERGDDQQVAARGAGAGRRRQRAAPPPSLRRSIPVRTFSD